LLFGTLPNALSIFGSGICFASITRAATALNQQHGIFERTQVAGLEMFSTATHVSTRLNLQLSVYESYTVRNHA